VFLISVPPKILDHKKGLAERSSEQRAARKARLQQIEKPLLNTLVSSVKGCVVEEAG
jgi:hypothetical protein